MYINLLIIKFNNSETTRLSFNLYIHQTKRKNDLLKNVWKKDGIINFYFKANCILLSLGVI